MSKGFSVFKKRLMIRALVKSGIFGVSCGIFASSLYAVTAKLGGSSPNLLWCVCLGAGALLLFGALMLCLLRPTDKRIAKKLDTDLELHERVQTMLEFESDNGLMAELQRRDTDQRLVNAKTKMLKNRDWWCHVIAPLIAAALLVPALAIPVNGNGQPGTKEDPPFVMTDWQKAALEELIRSVKGSDMQDAPKAQTVTELERLLRLLDTDVTEGVMKTEVEKAMFAISGIEDKANSYNDLYGQMEKSTDKQILTLAKGVKGLGSSQLTACLDEIKKALDGAEYEKALDSFVSEGEKSLTQSGVAEGDALLEALKGMISSLKQIRNDMPSYTAEWAKGKSDEALDAASDPVGRALYIQQVNKTVATSAIYKLMEIFGIKELPEGLFKAGENSSFGDSSEKDEYIGDDGGAGSGEIVYAGDDQIYDPDQDKHVQYGSVINDFYAKVNEKFLGGDIPETLEKYISDYFASLYDGSDKEKEDK